MPFLREAAAAGEPALVVVAAAKIAALQAELGGEADAIQFADMDEVGHNPARIIPAWQDFLTRHGGGGTVRGVGEPIWAGRSPDELVECQRHEALLNVAFAGSGDWRLLCPYDVVSLPDEVIEEAQRSHPVIVEDGIGRASEVCRDLDDMAAPFDVPLPPAPGDARRVTFDRGDLSELRALVSAVAIAAGFSGAQVDGVVLAVHEIAANSVRHGGGGGVLQLWREGDTLICDVRDQGHFDEPLIGRVRPKRDSHGSRGVWMANQLCDLVQMRSFPDGNVVRLHIRPTQAVSLSV